MSLLPGLLFDLDGTLLDTAPEFTYCLNLLLKEVAKPPLTVEQLQSHVSFGAVGMLSFAFGIVDTDPHFMRLKERFLALYTQNIGSQTRYFPGIAALLAQLATSQRDWGIVTNKPHQYTRALLAQFPLLQKALCVVSGDSLPTHKPDPAPLLHACQMLNRPPAQCWYIGDAKTDIEASQRAGMPCALARYGYIPSHENPMDWGADQILCTPEEITSLICTENGLLP